MFKSLKSNVKDVDSKGRIVVAANAFGNIDYDGDISMPGSFDRTIKENWHRVKWFLNHDRDKLLGVPLIATATQEYLQIEGQLNLNKDIGKDIWEDYKLYAEYGKSLEHSIGVDPILSYPDPEMKVNGRPVNRVKEWKLWEYSTLTSWGANERTPMLSMKGASNVANIDWLELCLKKGNYTDEAFIEIEKSLNRIKSLIVKDESLSQPMPADVLADVSETFLKTLTD